MSWIFHRHSRKKSKASLASTAEASPPPFLPTPSSQLASTAALSKPASAISVASPPTSKNTTTLQDHTPTSAAPSAAPAPSPSRVASTPLAELRSLIADFEADVEPSESRRIIRKVYEGATDAALSSLDILPLVPVVSAYVPVVRSVLLIGLLARAGSEIRDACRELATRIARLYELLRKVQGDRADDLRELYRQRRGGALGVLRLGIDSSLLSEIQDLHVKLDRLQIDFTPHILLGLVNTVESQYRTPSLQVPASNIGLLQPPPPAPMLIGREQWLAMVLQPLQSLGHVALTGAGGIGKSSLALTAIHSPELGLRFQRKVLIRCDTTPSAEALVEELVKVRGQALGFTEEPVGVMVRALEQMTTLLVLDNLETPLDADGASTKDLIERLASISTVSLLITTRNPSLSRQPLPRPILILVIPELSLEPAKELFLSIAPDFEKDRNLTRLLHLLDGYPLAICLVASRAQDEDSIADVLKLWQSELEEFDQEGRTRKDSLAISLSLSFSSTTFTTQPKAQQLLSVLAALPRPLAHSRIHALNLSAGERALVHTSLVKQSRQGSRHSVRLLAPIREYVRRSKDVKLAELSPATKRQVVESFLDDFERLPKGGAGETMNPSFQEARVPLDFASNAVVSLEFAFSMSSVEAGSELKKRVEGTVLRLALRMGHQRRYIGSADDAMALFEGLKGSSAETSSPLARLALALHQAQLGEAATANDPLDLAVVLQQATTLLDEAQLEPAAATQLRAEIYFAFGHLAQRAVKSDEPDDNPLLQKALALATEVDDLELAAWCHYALAIHGKSETQTDHASMALKIAEEEDLLVLAANLRVALALLEEDIPERKTLLQEAIDLFLQLSDTRSLRESYYALGLATRKSSSTVKDLLDATECFARCELLFSSNTDHTSAGYLGTSPYSTTGVRWDDRAYDRSSSGPRLASYPRDSYTHSHYINSPYTPHTQRSAYSVERGWVSTPSRGMATFSRGMATSTMGFGRFRALNAFQLYRTQLSLEALSSDQSRLSSRDSRPSDEAYSNAFALFESCNATEWCSFLEAHRLRFSDSARQLELLKQELTSPKSFTTADPVLEAYKTYEIISNPFFTDSGAEDEEKEAFLAQAASIVKLEGIHRDFALESHLRAAIERAGQPDPSTSFDPPPSPPRHRYDVPPPPRTIAPSHLPRRRRPTSPLPTTFADDDVLLPSLRRAPSVERGRRELSSPSAEERRASRAYFEWSGGEAQRFGDGGGDGQGGSKW